MEKITQRKLSEMWIIDDIEKITENEAEKLAEERETIKEHNVYF